MFGAFSAARLAASSAIVRAKRYALDNETLQAWGGGLLIVGFGLLGSALPHVC